MISRTSAENASLRRDHRLGTALSPVVYSKVLLNMTCTKSWEQDLGVPPSLLSLTTRLLYKNLV